MLPATLDRLAKLLGQPDEPSLIGRGHRSTCRGADDRWERIALPLRIAWEVRRRNPDGVVSVGRHASANPAPRRLEFRKR